MRLFSENKVFIIAEMANAHEGELSVAKEITKKAAEAKADGIKYQRFTADELATKDHENYALYKKLEMTDKEWSKLVRFAKSLKLRVFVDVFGLGSAKKLDRLDIDGYKIHSSDIANPTMLNFMANTDKVLLLSAGGSYPNEIEEAIRTVQKKSKEIALMHGFQGYPTTVSDMNFNRIFSLKEKFGLPVGVMDHVDGDLPIAKTIPLVAVGAGARIVEKHLTLDRAKKGLDYFSSLNPDEFQIMVRLVRESEKSLGENSFDLPTNELTYRKNHKKSLISKRVVKKGEILRDELFEYKRAKTKNDIVSIHETQGRRASKTIPKGTVIDKSMIDKNSHKIAATIACRVNSSRLVAKQMQLIDNRPIIHHVITQLKTSKLIDEIVLAISEDPGNDVFIDFAKKQKLKYVIGSDRDVLKRLIDAAKYVNADTIFRITPENPYIYWEGIDQLIKKHVSGDYDFSDCYATPLGSGFEIAKLEAFEISHSKGKDKHRSELCSLYIQENQKKFKIYHANPPKHLQRPELRVTVDTPEDLYVARKIFEKIGKGEKPIPLEKIIEFLDDNPEIKNFNSKIPLGVSRIWIADDPLRKKSN